MDKGFTLVVNMKRVNTVPKVVITVIVITVIVIIMQVDKMEIDLIIMFIILSLILIYLNVSFNYFHLAKKFKSCHLDYLILFNTLETQKISLLN